jgi:hypothetical protein
MLEYTYKGVRHPKHWVFSRNLYVIPDQRFVIEYAMQGKDFTEKFNEMTEWCHKHTKGRVYWERSESPQYKHPIIKFYFSKKSDAMNFKIIFG